MAKWLAVKVNTRIDLPNTDAIRTMRTKNKTSDMLGNSFCFLRIFNFGLIYWGTRCMLLGGSGGCARLTKFCLNWRHSCAHGLAVVLAGCT